MEINGHEEVTGEEIDDVYDKMRDNVAPDEAEEARRQEEFCN